MAIQKGVIQFRGKVGNVVGMKNGFGTKDSAFMRELVTDIKNPQSDFQMTQRAKMLPAVLFRRQLESVVSRAWEGTKYGGPSTREFMKYALKEPWENIPQLVKDSTIPIPGAYLVSRGSLAPVGTSYRANTALKWSTGLKMTGEIATIGELSENLLANNPQLRAGDQLTFIVAYTPSETSIEYVIYTYKSLFIDLESTQAVSAALGNISLNTTTGGNMLFGIQDVTNLGGACVLSRDGSNSHQRSTERMAVNKDALSDYFGYDLTETVADSYRTKQSALSSDWPYESSEGSSAAKVRITVTASPSTAGSVTGGGLYEMGETVTVVANAESGYRLSAWYEGENIVSTQSSYQFEATVSRTLTARFDEEDRP